MHKIKNKADFCVGLGIMLFMVVMWTQTLELADTVRLLPRIVIIVGGLCGLGITIKSFLKEGETARHQKTPRKVKIAALIVAATIFLMLLLTEVIGMYTCLFIMICCISIAITYMESGWDLRKILFALLYDAIVIAIIYVMFHVVLSLNTPTGFLI